MMIFNLRYLRYLLLIFFLFLSFNSYSLLYCTDPKDSYCVDAGGIQLDPYSEDFMDVWTDLEDSYFNDDWDGFDPYWDDLLSDPDLQHDWSDSIGPCGIGDPHCHGYYDRVMSVRASVDARGYANLSNFWGEVSEDFSKLSSLSYINSEASAISSEAFAISSEASAARSAAAAARSEASAVRSEAFATYSSNFATSASNFATLSSSSATNSAGFATLSSEALDDILSIQTQAENALSNIDLSAVSSLVTDIEDLKENAVLRTDLIETAFETMDLLHPEMQALVESAEMSVSEINTIKEGIEMSGTEVNTMTASFIELSEQQLLDMGVHLENVSTTSTEIQTAITNKVDEVSSSASSATSNISTLANNATYSIEQHVATILNTSLDDLLDGSVLVASLDANTSAVNSNTTATDTNTNALNTTTAANDNNTNALNELSNQLNQGLEVDVNVDVETNLLGDFGDLTDAVRANTDALNSGGDIGVSDNNGVGWGDSIGTDYIDGIKSNLETLLDNEQQDGSGFQDDFTIQRLTELGGQGSNYGQAGNFAGVGGVCPFSTFSIPIINISVDTSFLCVYMRAIINLGFAIIIIFSLLFGFRWILRS